MVFLLVLGGMCWSKLIVKVYVEKLCIIFFRMLVVSLWLYWRFRKFSSFFWWCKFIAFFLLLTTMFTFWSKTVYTNIVNHDFNWMLTNLISFLRFFFSRCFLCISSSMIIRPICCFNLKLAFLFDNRTLANVGNKCSCFHGLINAIWSDVFSYFVLRVSNDLTTSDMPFPCFFLMCLNVSLREHFWHLTSSFL